MAKSQENKDSVYKDLPYRVAPDGRRAYDLNDYLSALSEREDGVLRKARRSISVAENGTALKVDGKIRYFKGNSG